jgi:hypothetical protein
MPPPAPPGATATPVADRWASLPGDLVRLIASRVLAGDLLDYVRFRAVCTGWRSGAASPRGRGVVDPRFHPRRWMMLPEGHGLRPGHPDLGGYIRFLNLDTGTLVRAHLPHFSDHCAIDSVDGLLLLLREDSAVRLLHPFTGDIVELPLLATLIPQIVYNCPAPYKIRRLADNVSGSVSFSAGAITVMLALYEVHRVAFATTLDREWNLSSWTYELGCPPAMSFQGKLYMACYVLYSTALEIFQIDPPVKDGDGVGSSYVLHPPKLIATVPEGNLIRPVYLAECDSEILLLGHKNFYMSQIVVFKLTDLVLQRYTPITSIGGNTLFISERSLCVASKALPNPMGDSVVHFHPTEHNPVQYHLISGTWSSATDQCSLYGPAPGPCSLIHLIYNCCIRNRWYFTFFLPCFSLFQFSLS